MGVGVTSILACPASGTAPAGTFAATGFGVDAEGWVAVPEVCPCACVVSATPATNQQTNANPDQALPVEKRADQKSDARERRMWAP